jgi:hypothetical protein
MIKMIPQPIVDIQTGNVAMEEWLCRPQGMTLAEYFDVLDPYQLWEREAKCIQEAIKQESKIPKMINITLSSLPYF